MLKRIVIAAAACLVFSSVAGAQTTETEPPPTIEQQTDLDIRCMAVGLTLVATAGENAQRQQAGMVIALYYLGRINGRTPDLDLETRMTELASGMTMQQLVQEQQRCSVEIAATGTQMTEMGRRMQERARSGR